MEAGSKSTVFKTEQGIWFWRQKWKKFLSESGPKGVFLKTYNTHCYIKQK